MSLTFDHIDYQYASSAFGLKDVNLTIRSGELVSVIGHSGSGKSTLLRLTAGLLHGYQGKILIHGEDVANKPAHLRNIGMVFQSYALFPHLSVLDNVAYGLKMRGMATAERRRQAQEMLARVGLADFAQRRPAALSGGQQQRVALARALAYRPQVLLLDEPLGALDATIRQQLRDQIRELQQSFSATTLLVTHDQEEALTLSDRIAVIEQGKLLQVDTPRNLYENPASAAVAKFVGQSTLFRGKVVATDTVDTGFVQWRADTQGFAIGDVVDILIRPEYVVANPAADALNRLSGACGAVRYLGPIHRYDFLIHHQEAPVTLLCEGRALPTDCVAIAPEHVRLLRCP